MVELESSKIGIIHATSTDLAVEAWLLSRPAETVESSPVSKVISIDAPVNEFPDATLSIKAPLFIRDILALFRDHCMWAQTSRVQNLLDGFSVPEEYAEYLDQYVSNLNVMKDLASKGVAQDQFRMNLPIVSHTEFTVKFSLRTWIKIVKVLDKLSEYIGTSSQGFSTKTTIDSFRCSLATTLSEAFKLTTEELSSIISTYVEAPVINYDFSNDVADEIISVGSFHQITRTVSYSLFAQAIRHRSMNVVSNFHQVLVNAHNTTLSSDIKISMLSSENMWKSILSKRQCWVAQRDIWSVITDPLGKVIKLTEDTLPCTTKGACPYVKDAELRYTDKDPGSPCPKFALLTGRSIPSDRLQLTVDDLTNRPKFWELIYNEYALRG